MNLAEAPELPARMLPNIYGVSLARWAYMGFHYGPDRNPMPDEIAAMDDVQQAESALKNYLELEAQRVEEESEAAKAAARQEQLAKDEAERREAEDYEAEIERRAQARAAEIIAEAGQPEPPVAVIPGPPVAVPSGEDDDTPPTDFPADVVADPNRKAALSDILAGCTSKVQLISEMKDVPWQTIKAAVVNYGKEPGDKPANIDILAEILELE